MYGCQLCDRWRQVLLQDTVPLEAVRFQSSLMGPAHACGSQLVLAFPFYIPL